MDECFIFAVKEKMEKDGVSTKELADRCEYVDETIRRILDRNIPIRLEMAVTIVVNLGLSLDEVCGIIKRRCSNDDGNAGTERQESSEGASL